MGPKGTSCGAQSRMNEALDREGEPQSSLGTFMSKQTLVKEKKSSSMLVLAETPETTDAFSRLPPLFALSVSLWPPHRLGFDPTS